ncbi:MAG TPA: protein kinase [Kofleriaceae bacterium]|nr:protein kinase [Kofleriaceae bacterium]
MGGASTPPSRLDEALVAGAGAAEVETTLADIDGLGAATDTEAQATSAGGDRTAAVAPAAAAAPAGNGAPATAAAAVAPAVPVARPARAVAPHGHLGRYVLGKRIGAGGMAVVYRARDPALERELAIKVLRPRMRGAAARDRLLREAQAMARLEHANVVPVFDVGTTGDNIYMVMPFMPGGTLGEWLGAEPRPWRSVLARFLAAGRGLTAAHAHGIVHRDFKPDNVLLGVRGEVRVADFGLAQLAAQPAPEDDAPTPTPAGPAHLTRTGAVLGTPVYMAPEQFCGGPVDARSDQFSFCVALWEGLYGERPFRPDKTAGESELYPIRAIRRGPHPPARDRGVPRWLRAMVGRGLRSEPGERWPSLERLLDRMSARNRRPRLIAIALAAGALIAGGVAAATALAGAGGAGEAQAVRDRDAGRGAARPSAARGFRISRITARGRISDAAVTSDGAHLAWAVGGDIVIQGTAGGAGQPRVVLRDAPEATLAFAPAGDRLAVTNPPGRTRILDVRSGAVLLDAAVGMPLLAFAGPDALVYSNHRPILEVRPLASLQGSRRCALPGDIRAVGDLTATATGEVLLVIDRPDGARALMRVGADCKNAVVLRVDHWLKAVAAAGDRIYGLRRAAGDLSLVALDRGGSVVDVRGLDGDATDLAGVASDGQAYFTRTEVEWRLLELDRGGRATERASGAQRTELAGSADGEWVAWIEDGDDQRALRVAPTDRMADRPAPIATGVMTVAWSPDGRRLAAILDAGGREELVEMDRDGAVFRRVPVADLDSEDWTAWLGEDAVVATSFDNRRLLRVDLASGAVRSLLEERGEIADPQSAADGSLVFAWDRDDRGASGVWLRAPDGALAQLREDADSSVHAAWSADDGAIVLYDRASGQLWRIARAGADPERMAPVPLAGNEWLPALWLRGRDRILAHVVRSASDLYVSRPE